MPIYRMIRNLRYVLNYYTKLAGFTELDPA
jgi:hypothetical protein